MLRYLYVKCMFSRVPAGRMNITNSVKIPEQLIVFIQGDFEILRNISIRGSVREYSYNIFKFQQRKK